MPKKITDISPPTSKLESKIPEIKRKEKRDSFSHLWKILIILGIGVLGVFALSTQAKLEVTLTPYLETFSFKETFEVNVAAENIDFEKEIIPGEFFEKEIKKWKQFESTGREEKAERAKGKIKVYNSHTPPTPITLRATTRFLSAEGEKIFRTPKKVYLPPAQIKKGKIVPSVVEIEVIAQEPGEEYNIGPSKFSIPGLVGTAFYYSVWAESELPMTGGFRKEVKVVSEEDIEKGKASIEELMLKEAKKALKNEIPKDFVLLEDAIWEEWSEVNCFSKPGVEVDKFSCEGKMKIKGLGFRASDLKKLSEMLAKNIISSSENLLKDSLQFKYQKPKIILEKGKLILDLEISGKKYKNIPKETISQQIIKKTKPEIERFIFANYPQVERIEIKFWPFWIKKAPKNINRIKVKLKVEGVERK